MDSTKTLATRVAESVADRISSSSTTLLSLAETTGIPRTTLMRRLAGVSPFNVEELEAIAEALGIRVADLIDITDAA